MSITIIRRIDDLGRVVIPKDARRQLGIAEGDEIEIEVRDDEIVLKPRDKGSNDKAIVEAAKAYFAAHTAEQRHQLECHAPFSKPQLNCCEDAKHATRMALGELNAVLRSVKGGEAS